MHFYYGEHTLIGPNGWLESNYTDLRTHAAHSVRFYRSTYLSPLGGCVLAWCLRQIQGIWAVGTLYTVQLLALLTSRCVMIILRSHHIQAQQLGYMTWLREGSQGCTSGHAKSIA